MKNIKFRAWQKYHKKMVEVTSISFGNNGEINGVSTFVENQAPQRVTYKDGLGNFFLTDERGMVLELMQSTGLKDKNGVEIFEGDIVKNIRNGISRKVYWDTYCASFHLSKRGKQESNVDYWSLSNPKWNYEVIGNIYENPEVLEETKC